MKRKKISTYILLLYQDNPPAPENDKETRRRRKIENSERRRELHEQRNAQHRRPKAIDARVKRCLVCERPIERPKPDQQICKSPRCFQRYARDAAEELYKLIVAQHEWYRDSLEIYPGDFQSHRVMILQPLQSNWDWRKLDRWFREGITGLTWNSSYSDDVDSWKKKPRLRDFSEKVTLRLKSGGHETVDRQMAASHAGLLRSRPNGTHSIWRSGVGNTCCTCFQPTNSPSSRPRCTCGMARCRRWPSPRRHVP